MKKKLIVAVVLLSSTGALCAGDSLPPLSDGKVPQNVEQLWAGYDSTIEPLEVKIIREWQDGGITYRYLTYTIGTFKGRKSTMAAFYGFPADHQGRLPALIQMHGGGQRASVASVSYAAGNGYACLSINWGGRPMEDARPGEPTTDWGAVDATQTGHNSHYSSLLPDEKTIDPFESPRNNNWFLIVLAAKRGITFLQNQPEVDGQRIGAFGHSMGGKLTVMLAGADRRVKAAAPSCGGCGSAPESIRQRPGAGVRPKQSDLHHKTIDDARYLEQIKVPMLYVGPQNDFNGILDCMYANWQSIQSEEVAYTITPHMNHRATPEHAFTDILWFDDHLKGLFAFPKTPKLTATLETEDLQTEDLQTEDRAATVVLAPDRPDEVARVDIYYSVDPHILTRFWRTAKSMRNGNTWVAKCPPVSTDRPLYIMANVYYPVDRKLAGYPWLKTPPETFGISSELISLAPEQLRQARVRTDPSRNRLIEERFDDYHDWYRLEWGNPNWWSAYTRKIKDPGYAGPDGAKLLLDVKVDHDVTIFFELNDNGWRAYPDQPIGQYYAPVQIRGADQWQTVGVTVADFKPADEQTRHPLESWRHVTELGIRGRIEVTQDGQPTELPGKGNEPGAGWSEPREFRNLRWEGGTYPRTVSHAMHTPDGR